MRETTVRCNMCGAFTSVETGVLTQFKGQAEYPSGYDGMEIKFDLCDDCMTKLFQKMRYHPLDGEVSIN